MSRMRLIVLALVAAVVVIVAVIAFNKNILGPAAGQGITDDEIQLSRYRPTGAKPISAAT